MPIKLVLVFILLIQAFSTMAQHRRSIKPVEIEGNTNQEIEINFGLQKIISVKIANTSMPQYVSLIPNRFNLHSKISKDFLPQINKTLIQELRTPFTNEYTQMFKVNNKLIAFRQPYHFVVINQSEQNFEIVREFDIKQIGSKQLKIEEIEDSYLILILSKDEIVLVNQNETFRQKNVFNSTEDLRFKKLFQDNSTYYIGCIGRVAQIIKVQKGLIQIVKTIDLSGKDIEVAAFARGESSKQSQQIWLVDDNKGLFLMTLTAQLEVNNGPIPLYAQKECFQLDTMKENHAFSVVLTCSHNIVSKFTILVFDNDNIHYPFLLETKGPYQQRFSPGRYIFYHSYIIAQEAESMDIFTPNLPIEGKSNYQKHWITFASVNTFLFSTDTDNSLAVYMIHKGVLSKNELVEEAFSLAINTPQPIKESLNFTVWFLCQKQSKRGLQICQADVLLRLNIHNNIVSFVQYRSMNVALILILCTSLIALTLLCCHKYKSIYQKAYQQFQELANPNKCQI